MALRGSVCPGSHIEAPASVAGGVVSTTFWKDGFGPLQDGLRTIRFVLF